MARGPGGHHIHITQMRNEKIILSIAFRHKTNSYYNSKLMLFQFIAPER